MNNVSWQLLPLYMLHPQCVDLFGSVNVIVLVLVGFLGCTVRNGWTSALFFRSAVLTVLICIWAVRLGVFLFMRVLVRKRDDRFDKLRTSVVKFASFWALQAAWVISITWPLTLLNAAIVAAPEVRAWRFNLFDMVGWAVWALGFYFEVMADHQRLLHAQIPKAERAPPFMCTGLWSFSRHPNYFGEILLWFGVAFTAFQGVSSWSILAALTVFVSPAVSFYFIVYISGLPLAEARDDRRYSRLLAFQQYRALTSPLFPVPARVYMMIHPRIKRAFFFDRDPVQPGTIPMPKMKGNVVVEYSTVQTR